MKLITRAQWGARAPRARPPEDFTGATAHWEGPHMGTFPHASCPAKVRGIQAFHMDARGWSDIAYNAVVCPHGYVFEGRGQGVRSAANGTDVGNDADGAVCYLGGEGDPFTPEGAAAMADALHLVSPGGLRHAHRDWKPTTCPGDTIAAWVHSPAALGPGADQGEDDVTREELDDALEAHSFKQAVLALHIEKREIERDRRRWRRLWTELAKTEMPADVESDARLVEIDQEIEALQAQIGAAEGAGKAGG